MDKPIELSKPVAYDYQYAGVETCEGFGSWRNELTWDCPPDWMVETGKVKNLKPRYSQEYVSALLAELEAKDREIDAANARVDVMCAKAMNLTERAETAEQRIAELEAIRSDASQVFKEIGSELGCNPDNESIMMAIDALKERLATPVRLPDGTGWASDPYNQGRNKGIHQCADAIRAAGFTVEGDE